MRIFIALAILALATGCGILEELDGGREEMERLSSKGKKSAATAEAEEPEKKKTGWETIRSFSPGESKGSLVRCSLPSGSQYMDRSDCLARGGRAQG